MATRKATKTEDKKKTTPKNSGRATPKKQPKTVSTAQGWKGKSGHEVEVPSGNVCLARRPGMPFFIERGLIPNELMPMVQQAMDEQKAPSQRALKDIKMTPELIKQMTQMFDAVTVAVVIEPKVHPLPEDEEDRDTDLLYVDEVDDEDKKFLFNWAVGGTADVAQFRKESAKGLGALQPS